MNPLINVKAWVCNICGHKWLAADPKKPPTWCAKCRSRRWND